jgi:hypothetical protein
VTIKTSILVQNGVSEEVVSLLARLVSLIPWPLKRSAMGDVATTILDGKPRVAEDVFGWGRATVKLGINECRTKLTCVNDRSSRRKPKVEEKNPELLRDLIEIIDPQSQAESHLRTTLLYSNLTAKAVFDALLEKGWSEKELPTTRTISNILNRHHYQLRRVEKSQVKKKLQKPT